MRPRGRPGFTLIELLAVVAVVAVLIALVLPAAQAAREAARRAQCASNLKQIGVALHNYIAIHDAIPPAGSWSGSPVPPQNFDYPGGGGIVRGTNQSMKLRLLPFLEQPAIYQAYNLSLGDYNTPNVAGNETILHTRVALFVCPSDPNLYCGLYYGALNTGETNYPNTMGIEPSYTGGQLNGPSWYLGGDPFLGVRVTLAGVVDGTSHTAIFSEWVKGAGTGPSLLPALANVHLLPSGTMTGDGLRDAANCHTSSYTTWTYKGQYWSCQDTGRGGGYWHITFPNKKSCDETTGNFGFFNVGSLIGPSSAHPGGVCMLFLDGSVKFIKDSIAPQPYYGIATIAGGEVIAADAF